MMKNVITEGTAISLTWRLPEFHTRKEGKIYTPYPKDIPKIESVSCWDLYPDPVATSTDDCDYIINSSYSNVNKVNNMLGLPELNLNFQDVIVPIFNMEHNPLGLTIMDGPFCSIMPRGNRKNEFLLYHPKYSVISESNQVIDISNENLLDTYLQVREELSKYSSKLIKKKEIIVFNKTDLID